jgi:hypothetical protein
MELIDKYDGELKYEITADGLIKIEDDSLEEV